MLAAAASGERIEPWMFQFTKRDREFQAALVRAAEDAKNVGFFDSLHEFIAEQEREFIVQQKIEYWRLRSIAAEQEARNEAASAELSRQQARQWLKRKRIARAKQRSQQRQQPKPPQMKIKRSLNYNPTGMTFEQFLKQRGLYYSPSYKPPFARFVSGGAVDSNRRRH